MRKRSGGPGISTLYTYRRSFFTSNEKKDKVADNDKITRTRFACLDRGQDVSTNVKMSPSIVSLL